MLVCNGDKRCRVVVSQKSTKGTCDGRFAAASPVKSQAFTAPQCLAALEIIRPGTEGGSVPDTRAPVNAVFKSRHSLKLAFFHSPSDVAKSDREGGGGVEERK